MFLSYCTVLYILLLFSWSLNRFFVIDSLTSLPCNTRVFFLCVCVCVDILCQKCRDSCLSVVCDFLWWQSLCCEAHRYASLCFKHATHVSVIGFRIMLFPQLYISFLCYLHHWHQSTGVYPIPNVSVQNLFFTGMGCVILFNVFMSVFGTSVAHLAYYWCLWAARVSVTYFRRAQSETAGIKHNGTFISGHTLSCGAGRSVTIKAAWNLFLARAREEDFLASS